MGFKTDASFLRFLSMGALGTCHVMRQLSEIGFQPIELERYASSNKIWATKIKRLRLPDLLCVRTGMRVEVRAKSNLEIRMSHAPGNPDRHWDAGLTDADIVALVPCKDEEAGPVIGGGASFFSVADLRQSVDPGQLSRLKAASEGSEQHLTWPTVVSSRPGTVTDVTTTHLAVEWGGDGKPARRYTYALRGKTPYVSKGGQFEASMQFLAGTPKALADLGPYLKQRYEPLTELLSIDRVARYSAAKALAFRDDLQAKAQPILEHQIGADEDPRVALEIASTAAGMGVQAAYDFIRSMIRGNADGPMQMEAIFVLTELGRRGEANVVTSELDSIARDRMSFGQNEARQAAVWGLGHTGVKAYGKLVAYLDDPEENVALHAIAAFGPDTPTSVILDLVNGIRSGSPRFTASCSEALQVIGSNGVIETLAKATSESHPRRPWLVATLGRLPEPAVRTALKGHPLLIELEPLLLRSSTENWLGREEAQTSLAFLRKQCV